MAIIPSTLDGSSMCPSKYSTLYIAIPFLIYATQSSHNLPSNPQVGCGLFLEKRSCSCHREHLIFSPLKDLRKDNCIHNKEYFKNNLRKIKQKLFFHFLRCSMKRFHICLKFRNSACVQTEYLVISIGLDPNC